MEDHYKLYEGYVKEANECRRLLNGFDYSETEGNQVYSQLRAVSVDYTFALLGYKNHDLYFGHLGGDGGEPEGSIQVSCCWSSSRDRRSRALTSSRCSGSPAWRFHRALSSSVIRRPGGSGVATPGRPIARSSSALAARSRARWSGTMTIFAHLP